MTNHEPGGRSIPSPTDPDVDDTPRGGTPGGPSMRLRGAGQLLAALPHLLGYLPDHSLVLVAMTPGMDRRRAVGRVVFTGRVDLPREEQITPVVDQFAGALQQLPSQPPPLLSVFGYDLPEVVPGPHPASGPRQPGDVDPVAAATLERAARELARRSGGVLHELAWVRARGRRVQTIVHEGAPVAQPSWQEVPRAADVPAVADLVLDGRGARPSRAHVARQVRHRDSAAISATTCAVSMLSVAPERLDVEEALGALGSWVVCAQEPSPRQRAWIAMVLQDKGLRDVVLARWAPELFSLSELVGPEELDRLTRLLPTWKRGDTVACLERLLTLASQLPEALTAPVLTIACGAAWARGEGTLANETCDLALEVDPDYTMAQLLRTALERGVRPPALRRGSRAGGRGGRSVA